MRSEQEMLEIIIKVATEDERIRAAYMYGSRAKPNVEKDKYQDYDIAFVVTETETFQNDRNWLNVFGDIAMLFESERNRLHFFGNEDTSILSRRCVFSMLFKDGNRADFVIETKEEAIKDYIAYKLAVILLDKDGFLPENVLANDDFYIKKPTENMYRACCSGFWWFLIYVVKGIARNQLPFAMESFNSFNRLTLNQMTDWYIGTQTNFSVSTGQHGKYYEKYLPKGIYDLYTGTYSDGNYTNFWEAIFLACKLFNRLALSVGTHFGFIYNHQEEDGIIEYLQKVKNDCSK